MKDPILVDKLFSDSEFNDLKNYLLNRPKDKSEYDEHFGRYCFADSFIDKYFELATIVARDIFNSKTLVPSYSLFAHYEGENAKLWEHKDDNACTYTLDFCVYQEIPWGLFVEEKEYFLNENQALGFYGNDQKHSRGAFKPGNIVAMIFFHFVEPDHWWLTKGPGYIDVIRGLKTEEEWEVRQT